MASEIKVNKISPESGTTLTLGDSGDTINFGSGVLPNFENLTVTGDLTVDTNSLKVDSTNNFVGIGTASPSVALDVVGAITASGNITGTLATAAQPNITSVGTLTSLNVDASAGTGVIGITLDNGTVSTSKDSSSFRSQLTMSNTTGQVAKFDTASDDLFLRFADDLAFQSIAGSEYMRIDSSGQVGIGTTSPQSLFHIVGSSTSSQVIIENTDAGAAAAPDIFLYRNSASPADNDVLGHFEFRGENSAGEETRYAVHNAKIVDVTDGTEDAQLEWQILNDGSFQKILTMNPTELVINEDSRDTNFRVESDTHNDSLFVQGSDGKVGLTTSTPQARLHLYDFSGSGGFRITRTDNITGVGMHMTTDSARNFLSAYGDLVLRTNSTGDGTNASERMRILSSGNIGINSSSPSTKLEVRDAATAIKIKSTGSTGYTQGSLLIEGHESSNTPGNRGQGIYLFNHGNDLNWYMGTTYQGGGDFAICSLSDTAQQSSTADDGNSRLVIDTSGNVLVGKTSADTATAGVELDDIGRIGATRSGNIAALFNRLSSDGEIVRFQKDGTEVGNIGAIGGDLAIGTGDAGLRFYNSGDSIFPVNTSSSYGVRDNATDLGYSGGRFKDLYLGGGIYLGGTGSANELDDYEEGTWTATYTTNGTDFTSVTYDFRNATYTKIGRQVTCSIHMRTDAITKGSASGDVLLGGLPFQVDGTTYEPIAIGTAFAVNNPSGLRINNNTTNASLQKNYDNTHILVSDMGTGTNDNFMATVFTYFTD